MSEILALTSAVLFGVADFAGGIASRTVAAWRVIAWSQLLGLPILLIALAMVGNSGYTSRDLAFGVLAGSVGLIGIGLLYMALAAGEMSIVSPIVGIGSAALPLVWGLAVGDVIGTLQWIGITAGLLSVALLAGSRRGKRLTPRPLAYALMAAIAFAVFFVAIAQTSPESGLWPLAAARIVTVPAAFLLAARTSTPAPPRGATFTYVAFVGLTDIGANIAVLLALQTGMISVTAILSSLYPAFTVLAAVTILRERPTPRQAVGIAVAVVAGAVLAV